MVKARLPVLNATISYGVNEVEISEIGKLGSRMMAGESEAILTLELKIPKSESGNVIELVKQSMGTRRDLEIGFPETLLREPVKVGSTKESSAEITVSDVYQDKW